VRVAVEDALRNAGFGALTAAGSRLAAVACEQAF
jgi:hypothetical protein